MNQAYKSLANVERAFRTLKGVDMAVRPVFHWLSTRVKAHVFLCMLPMGWTVGARRSSPRPTG